MKKRSYKLEILDKGPDYYSIKEYQDCIYKIGLMGRLLGGNRATLKAFQSLQEKPKSILDVGCGAGLFSIWLAQKYPDSLVVGIDTSKEAISYARKYANSIRAKKNNKLHNLSFEHRTNPKLQESDKSYDIVLATLMCHHLKDEELIDFLRRAKKVARKAVIINDLHRHKLAYILFSIIAPCFRSRLVTNDGLLSIKRGFKKKEWEHYLKTAGFSNHEYSITWRWAFRWIVAIKISPT